MNNERPVYHAACKKMNLDPTVFVELTAGRIWHIFVHSPMAYVHKIMYFLLRKKQ